jgi:predicted kinase
MNLVIVSGPEASGKSVIARHLAKTLDYPYLAKDVLKEALYDLHPRSTWHSKWYQGQAKDQMFSKLESYIKQDKSLILESNFDPEDRPRLATYIDEGVVITELFCTAKGLTSFKRFVKRNETGERHPDHHDRRLYLKIFLQNVFLALNINRHYQPFEFSERVMRVDGTNFSKINYDKIAEFIKQK